MKVLCTEQGTQEWLECRKGKITGSGAKLAISGRPTKGRRLYVAKIADDLQGIPDFEDEDVKPWFIDGRFYESWARGWYAWKTGNEVEETGFCVHDDYSWIGCSPDGLVGDDGLVEIKYRKTLHAFHKHAALNSDALIMPQLQTQLFVTGRAWVDYVNYWRSDDHELEQGHIKRIERNPAYIENTLLPAFVDIWREVQAELDRRQGPPMPIP